MNRLQIVVLGYIVRGPIGGMAWHHLQYVLGLTRLGHEVLFIEDSDDYPSCYDPSSHQVGTDPSYGLRFAADAFGRLALGGCWAYHDAHLGRWYGPAADRAVESCEQADVAINVSGVNPIRDWLGQVPTRILIDTDPAFTQVRHLTNAPARLRAAQHNAFFTFAESIGSADCSVPDDGFDWHPTRQPIVLEAWPVTEGPRQAPYTTVMQWDSYASVEYSGQRFEMKARSFDLVRDLPRRAAGPFEIALGSASAPRDDLSRLGWQIVDPLVVTRDPWFYQAYLRQSHGELSVAKHGYVASHSGWFSERTACYLASGRPAIVQDTGFSAHIPCGEGLFAFDDASSALDAIVQVDANYDGNCRTARNLAAAYFDSNSVLTSLLTRACSIRNPG